MKATVTFNEEAGVPVLVLTTESADENQQIHLLTAFEDFTILIELDEADALVTLHRSD
jgi:hypothetical protein